MLTRQATCKWTCLITTQATCTVYIPWFLLEQQLTPSSLPGCMHGLGITDLQVTLQPPVLDILEGRNQPTSYNYLQWTLLPQTIKWINGTASTLRHWRYRNNTLACITIVWHSSHMQQLNPSQIPVDISSCIQYLHVYFYLPALTAFQYLGVIPLLQSVILLHSTSSVPQAQPYLLSLLLLRLHSLNTS